MRAVACNQDQTRWNRSHNMNTASLPADDWLQCLNLAIICVVCILICYRHTLLYDIYNELVLPTLLVGTMLSCLLNIHMKMNCTR